MTSRHPIDLTGRHVVVAGLARSGAAACRALLDQGAVVTVLDAAQEGAVLDLAAEAEQAGARVALGPQAASRVPDGVDLIVSSPGWPPSAPLLVEARQRHLPVWSEVELAWRLRREDAAPWLVVTGTNGKTTTTRMLESILRADGRQAVAAGNIGAPLVAIVTAQERQDVLAIEVSSAQLHAVHTVSAHAAVVLNLAPDHLDWHGTFAAYRAAKRVAYDRCRAVAVHNVDEPVTGTLVAEAALGPACATVGFRMSAPAAGELGLIDGVLLDRAFGAEAVELAGVSDVHPAAPHNIANALAASALARSVGVASCAVSAGLRAFVPERHRVASAGLVDGVAYVDDSKATNPHAAEASLAAYPSVVWVAGGLAKGADFDSLVQRHAGRMRAAVLLGTDRALIAAALSRHAPGIPVVEVTPPETSDMSLMDRVVHAARAVARPGDTVLLAPACASWDQFTDYTERGREFAAAVGRLRSDAHVDLVPGVVGEPSDAIADADPREAEGRDRR